MAKNNNNKPNTNINHINLIEGLMSQVDGHIQAISPQKAEQYECLVEVRLAIKSLQEKELFELRKVFE